jgi:hypothetical protein
MATTVKGVVALCLLDLREHTQSANKALAQRSERNHKAVCDIVLVPEFEKFG